MNKLELEFVPYAEALELKELGFDEPCFVYWVFDGVEITFSTSHNKSGWSMIGFRNSQMTKKAGLCTAPTFSQAFRWFREKYNLDSFCRQTNLNGWSYFKISKIETDEIIKGYSNFNNSYKEVELACLRKLISIVKELKNHETTKTKH